MPSSGIPSVNVLGQQDQVSSIALPTHHKQVPLYSSESRNEKTSWYGGPLPVDNRSLSSSSSGSPHYVNFSVPLKLKLSDSALNLNLSSQSGSRGYDPVQLGSSPARVVEEASVSVQNIGYSILSRSLSASTSNFVDPKPKWIDPTLFSSGENVSLRNVLEQKMLGLKPVGSIMSPRRDLLDTAKPVLSASPGFKKASANNNNKLFEPEAVSLVPSQLPTARVPSRSISNG